MKIGKLQFKDYAAKKPLGLLPNGEFLTAKDVVSQPSLSLGSAFALDLDAQVGLAVERYKMEPDFTLGVIGMGLVTKSEVLKHLEQKTEFGDEVRKAEMAYCSELLRTLAPTRTPAEPRIPKGPMRKVPDWKPVKRCIWLRIPTRAVFCENTTDGVTKPIAKYRIANVHPVFKKRGFTVVSLTGTNDVRRVFVPHAKNSLTVYLSGVGHGNYDLYTGHHGDRILQVGRYDPAEVKGKAIHFLSCRTAARLGPDTVKKGARCYAGYTENFTFVWDDPRTRVNEFLLFVKSDSVFDIMMANGATAQQAYAATIQAFNAAIARVPGTAAATWLAWDRDHLALHGSGRTKIVPYRYVKICFPLLDVEKQAALAEAGELVD